MERILPLEESWDRYNHDLVPSLYLGHGKNISGEKLGTALEAASKREGRAQNLDQNRTEYEQLLEKIKAKRLKIDDPGLEIQDAVFDFNVVETSEEEIRIVTQTEEFENLFACR